MKGNFMKMHSTFYYLGYIEEHNSKNNIAEMEKKIEELRKSCQKANEDYKKNEGKLLFIGLLEMQLLNRTTQPKA